MLPATTNIFCCVFNLLEGRQTLSCALVAGGVVTNLQEVEALFVTQKRVFNTHFTKSGATKISTESITGRLWEEKPAWPSCSYWNFKIMKTFVHVFPVHSTFIYFFGKAIQNDITSKRFTSRNRLVHVFCLNESYMGSVTTQISWSTGLLLCCCLYLCRTRK